MTAVPPSTTCDFVIVAPTAHSFLTVTALRLHSFYLVLCSACPPLLPPPGTTTLSATPSPPLLLPVALPRPPTAVSLLSFHPDGPAETSFRLLQMLKETNLSRVCLHSAAGQRGRRPSRSAGMTHPAVEVQALPLGGSLHTWLCAPFPPGHLHADRDLGLLGSFL